MVEPICSCYRIYEGEIRALVREGVRSFERLQKRCGAGAACGTCHGAIDFILADETLKEGRARRTLAAEHPDQMSLF